MPLPVDREAEFQEWYGDVARKHRQDPNPDDPRHMYDWRGAFLSGEKPSWMPEHQQNRWTDRYKREGYEDVPDQPAGSQMLPDTFQRGETRRNSLADAMMKVSNLSGVPVSLLAKVLRAEGGGPGVVSSKGALGPMQVMPSLVRSYGEDPEQALHDQELNLTIGTRYLAELLNRFGGSEPRAMAAYNAGPTRLSEILRMHGQNWRRKVPAETNKYLQRVGY